MMGIHKGTEGEKRLLRIRLPDEVDGPIRDPVGLVIQGVHAAGVDLGRSAHILLRGGGPVLLGLPLALHLHFLIVLRALPLQPLQVLPRLAVAGGVDHIKAVAVLRPVVLLVLLGHKLGGDVHLSDGRRQVAVVPQHLGQGDLLVPQGNSVVPGPVVLRVAPREHRAPGRGTHRVLYKMVVEHAPV